jgi:mRNA-degrading endonuclease toxin of MazEF toxin-antitoxin module
LALSRNRGYIYDGFLRDVPDDPKPVLVISSNAVNRGMQPIVAQVTSTERARMLPTYVVLEPGEGGVRERSYVLCHEIATLEDEDIAEDPWGPMIPPQKLVAVERALMEALDIPYEAQN